MSTQEHQIREIEIIYWICPPKPVTGENAMRHATKEKPGALIHGSTIVSLGGCVVKVPMATPSDRQPRSKKVERCCSECAREVNKLHARHVVWDF